jgi:spermidine synthase
VRPGVQWMVHGALLVFSIVVLQIIPGEQWKPEGVESNVWQILLILAVSIGLPYFILSTTGPLVQAAFARRFPGRSPYRLFALSNLGSLLALVTFPFLFEPFFSNTEHSAGWSIAYVVFAISCLAALIVSRTAADESGSADSQLSAGGAANANPSLATNAKTGAGRQASELLLWLLLSLVPSVLLLATTSQLSHSVAVMPFLWIAPLALYLLSFIICFDKPAWYRRDVWGVLLLVAMTLMIIRPMLDGGRILFTAVIYLLALFAACMVCHGELAAVRPEPRRLTLYYLVLSLGGALGGVFVVLAAPALFVEFYELQLSLLATCVIFALRLIVAGERQMLFRVAFFGSWLLLGLCLVSLYFFADVIRANDSILPRMVMAGSLVFAAMTSLVHRANGFAWAGGRERTAASGLPRKILTVLMFISVAALAVAIVASPQFVLDFGQPAIVLTLMLVVLSALLSNGQLALLTDHAAKIAGAFVALCVVPAGYVWISQMTSVGAGVLDRSRDFFGLQSVKELEVAVDEFRRVMLNGQVIHGMQYLTVLPDGTREEVRKPTSYYGPLTGAGLALSKHPRRETDSFKIGVIGLGTGSIAYYARPGDELVFYEIKPDCERAARQFFTYLDDNDAGKEKTSVHIGDARIVLERDLKQGKSQQFDVLVVDAFSGDSPPRHLMTREAFELYRKHVKDDGIIAINISNSHFDFARVIVALTAECGWKTAHFRYRPESQGDDIYLVTSSWIVATVNDEFLQLPVVRDSQISLEGTRPVMWTDDFGGMWQIMRFRR